RLSFPQTLSGKFDEGVLQRRPLDADVGQLHAVFVEPLNHFDDDAGGAGGGDGNLHTPLVHGDLVGFGPARQRQIDQRGGGFDLDGGMGQRLFLNLARRADGDDAALIDDGHAVAEFLRLLDVVGGEEDGALLTAQVEHELVDFEAGLGVEAGGGLVEKEHLRVVEQGERQGEPLLLPAGEFAVLRVALLPELQALQELVAIHGTGVEGVEELHGLVDLDLLLEVGGLQADADAVLELAGLHLGIAAEDADASAGARAQALEDFDGGGLTGAIGAEQAEDIAGAHVEIYALDGRKTAVALAQGFHLDGIVHEFSSLSQAGVPRGPVKVRPPRRVFRGAFIENKLVIYR